jgi:hypothetical protein
VDYFRKPRPPEVLSRFDRVSKALSTYIGRQNFNDHNTRSLEKFQYMPYENGKFQFDKVPNHEALKCMRDVWNDFTSPTLCRRAAVPPGTPPAGPLLRLGHHHSAFVEEIKFAKREMNWLWMIYVTSDKKKNAKIVQKYYEQMKYIKDDTVDFEMTPLLPTRHHPRSSGTTSSCEHRTSIISRRGG